MCIYQHRLFKTCMLLTFDDDYLDMDARSLNDLRNLTHAVRETFTQLQKEEDLFTGKADLLALEYTADKLSCMRSTLLETSMNLAIVRAAAFCDPNDNRMATGGIQVPSGIQIQ